MKTVQQDIRSEAVGRIEEVIEAASMGSLSKQVATVIVREAGSTKGPLPATVDVIGNWLRLEVPIGLKLEKPTAGQLGLADPKSGISPWEALCLTSQLPGLTKLSARLGRSQIILRSEILCSREGAAESASVAYDGLLVALDTIAGEASATSQIVPPGGDRDRERNRDVCNDGELAELCQRAGWDAKSRADGVKVDLKGDRGRLHAVLRGTEQGVRAELPILKNVDPSPQSRLGLGLLLLTLNAIAPGVRATAPPVHDSVDGINVCLDSHLTGRVTEERIDAVLLALSGAGELCSAEIERLLVRVVADAYVASNGWPDRAARRSD